jgi:cell division control protein 6
MEQKLQQLIIIQQEIVMVVVVVRQVVARLHQKLVLLSICLNEENGLRNISTGDIYRTYSDACIKINVEPLTTRRVSSLLNELDTLGLIIARNVSKGRGGRSKQVNSAIPKAIDAISLMSDHEPLVHEAALGKYKLQSQL